MSNIFTIDFDSDSSQGNEPVQKIGQSSQNIDLIVSQTQRTVINSVKKQNDKYSPNKISKNILFNQDNEDFIHQNNSQERQSKQTISKSRNIEGSEIKNKRRKKVDTKIKLEPLKNLQFAQKSQKIQLIKASSLMKTQSQLYPSQPNKFQDQNLSLISVKGQKFWNIEVGSSSNEEDEKQEQKNLEDSKRDGKEGQRKLKLDLLSLNTFFQYQDEQNNQNDDKKNKRKNKMSKSFKKSSQQNIYVQQSDQRFDAISKQDENQQQEKTDIKQGKVEIQNQLNPQISKKNTLQENIFQQDYLSKINGSKFQENSQFENLKCLLFQSLMKNSVLNLRLKRNQSLLNFLSPEFRIEFHHDHYFIMNSKKTSSKPTSTFTFSGSLSTFDESSKKYLGKMKSNIVGDLYNIFGPGLNPSNARDKNVPPRQLLATVLYKTEVFGTGKPKELIVFLKKPECQYYRDFRGIKMYNDEVPLNQLFDRYLQNRQNIQVLHTRKPTHRPETKEYVMNFDGKVKISSIKNFILEDRQNQNEKVLLFGKVTQENFVLDIHSPMIPIVGIGVALTMFDTRIGSD